MRVRGQNVDRGWRRVFNGDLGTGGGDENEAHERAEQKQTAHASHKKHLESG
jgi:hypothetical protein